MKERIKKIIIRFLYKKRIRKYCNTFIQQYGSDAAYYIYELLVRDQVFMINEKLSAEGYYDLDLQYNAMFQEMLQHIVEKDERGICYPFPYIYCIMSNKVSEKGKIKEIFEKFLKEEKDASK